MSDKKSIVCLTDLREGESGYIVSITGGKGALKRLADLGLSTGTCVTVISRTLFNGPVQIEVCSSRLVIGQGLAAKIMVEQR
jgi:Fe2+ transport system protein FeoA